MMSEIDVNHQNEDIEPNENLFDFIYNPILRTEL